MKPSRLQVVVHVGVLSSLSWLVWAFFTHHLTANPIRGLTLRTGQTALILLALSLACTPLNRFLGWSGVMRVRRALGLYAFGYASLHCLVFLYDYGWIGGEGFDVTLAYQALFDKRYALAGLAAFLCLVPLAITSTQGWVRRLGRHWQTLHRLAYVAAVLAVVHFIWLVKADLREPLLYGAVIGLLLLLRLPAGVAQALRLNRRA